MAAKQPVSSWNSIGKGKETKEETPTEPTISFERVTPAMSTKELKVAVHGQPKAGKTRFAMSSAVSFGPTYIISTEPGVAPLSRLFPDKEIYCVRNSANEPTVYEMNPDEIFETEIYKTLANISNAVKSLRAMCLANPSSVKTIVLDSVTDVWKWVQEWGKLEVLKIDRLARVKNQYDWGPMNLKYENIIMQLISLPCHVIFTGQDKEKYAGQYAPTGEYEARWQKQTPFKVDIVVEMRKYKDPKTGKTVYEGEIEDIRHMGKDMESLAGTTIKDPTFDKLVEAIQGTKT
jgi:hypothetical protein